MKPSDLAVVLNGLEAVARAFMNVNGMKIDKVMKNSSINRLSSSLRSTLEEKTTEAISCSAKPNGLLNIATEVKERGTVVAESVKQYSAFIIKQSPVFAQIETPTDFEIDHPIIRGEFSSSGGDGTMSESHLPETVRPPEYASNLQQTLQMPAHVPKMEYETSDFSEKVSKSISVHPSPKFHTLSKLSDQAQERKVPATQFSRAFEYISLAASVSFGAGNEFARRKIFPKSGKKSNGDGFLSANPFLTETNANKIVDTLCKVRGAALKLGQMLSIQDNAMINPQLAAVFERVRQSADFMPTWQMERVLRKEWGPDWREKLLEFDSKPFAAASIGQVHQAKLLDGTDVALKIQYPGVAKGIESDIKSLMGIIKFWNLVPKGMFLENVMSVAKRELRKEVDYINEAQSGKRFKTLLEPFPEYLVPQVYEELCTRNILAAQLVYGTPVDNLENESQDLKNQVCERLLRLCLMEIFLFRFMQTDPNWANFLYNFDTQQIVLLDFGASNEYTPEFVDTYMKIIKASSEQDRESVLHFSQQLGFLTGYETKTMEEAHIDAVMILGEAFACKKPFDFKKQNMTQRIHHLVPIMLKHRITPPPEETYSLHRKMSGIFLLCTKLGAVIDCSKLFDEVYGTYVNRKADS